MLIRKHTTKHTPPIEADLGGDFYTYKTIHLLKTGFAKKPKHPV